MIIYTDQEGRIKDVEKTNNPTLIRQEIDDKDNFFKGWSKAKICAYKVQVVDGRIVMATPYIDSRLLDGLDHIGKQIEPYTITKIAYYGDTEMNFYDVPDGNITVYVKDIEGNYPNYTVNKIGNTVTVNFEAVQNNTEITISVL